MKLDPSGRPAEMLRQQEAALRSFATLLARHALTLGLVSPADIPRIWERHILDSLRAVACLPSRCSLLVDLGSGGGLPGIPLAIACPDTRVVLIEASRRKAAFIEFAVAELALGNVTVEVCRAENARVTSAQACTARAVGRLRTSWALAAPLLEPSGVLVYFAGRGFRSAGDARREIGDEVVADICVPGTLEEQGPLVIIKRTTPYPEETSDER